MDYLYLILVLPAVIFSLWASIRVNTTFKKYSKIRSMRGITGAEAARRVLDANGLQHIRIEQIPGNLTDHYDPRSDVIRLSESVYGNTSVAAVGVACHEAGHAVQHAENYAPVKIRAAIIPVTNIGSRLAIPLIILGILLNSLASAPEFLVIAYIGVACYGLCTLFQLVTLPTEFDASRRALRCIESYGILGSEEIGGARRVLTAAAMTYVAALAVSLMQLLRLFLMVSGNSRRR
ncbi:MAG TPA: peptidase [Clostridiales bacterium]|jgi:Zn-dependent membrane protease YugP|nr:zinc metallopeptidase [Candidatus Apopatosoma intestinale]HBO65825.1 peptidase [Candidatus Apopatosoma intestinale]